MGAHSFRRVAGEGGGGERFANQRGVDKYLAEWGRGDRGGAGAASVAWTPSSDAAGLSLYEHHGPAALAREAMWLSLRRLVGLSCREFAGSYGVDPTREFAEAVAAMSERGWLELVGDRLRLTARGVLFADEVGAAFL
jgi:hypothetical protein